MFWNIIWYGACMKLFLILTLICSVPLSASGQFFGGVFKAREKALELEKMQEARGLLLELISARDPGLLPKPGTYADSDAYFAALQKAGITVGQAAENWNVVELTRLEGRAPLFVSSHLSLSKLDDDVSAAVKELKEKVVLVAYTDGSIERIKPAHLAKTVAAWKSNAKILSRKPKNP